VVVFGEEVHPSQELTSRLVPTGGGVSTLDNTRHIMLNTSTLEKGSNY
jgi:hypothetical protein